MERDGTKAKMKASLLSELLLTMIVLGIIYYYLHFLPLACLTGMFVDKYNVCVYIYVYAFTSVMSYSKFIQLLS